jgi:hypothetical protein
LPGIVSAPIVNHQDLVFNVVEAKFDVQVLYCRSDTAFLISSGDDYRKHL